MLVINPTKKIYIYSQPVDMRKSINGLIIILLEEFDQNPQTGDIYVFSNKNRNKIKCLLWDKNGFVLYYKRLERGRFIYSKHLIQDKIIVSELQLKALFFGFDFCLIGGSTDHDYTEFF
jgi:transposase